MSDDERSEREESPAPPPPPVEKPVEKKPFVPPQEHHFGDEGGRSEAELRMEAEMRKRKERADEEWAEYEEIRAAEREKLEEEITELRERRERRKQERAEEEKRLAELRAAEEQKRRAEEEERQTKKREEENRKREEREKKRREAEERSKLGGGPNFTIVKKEGGGVPGAEEGDAAAGGVPQKSKEQLEAERRAALEQRCKPLSIDGLGAQQLAEKAKELFERLKKLESDKYDYMKRFEQQNFDMMELTEKARQMNKGGKKSNIQAQTNDPLAQKMSGIPGKIVMYSQYERVTDPRPFGERKDCYTGPSYKEEYQRVMPTKKVVMTEMGAKEEGDLDVGHAQNNTGGEAVAAEEE